MYVLCWMIATAFYCGLPIGHGIVSAGPAYGVKMYTRNRLILRLIMMFVAAALLLPVMVSGADTPAADTPHRMKQYFFVLLRNGPDRTQSKEAAEKIQEGHMAHIREAARAGQLQIAGPFDDESGDWRGILIYDVKSIDEARALCAADPAAQAGRLVCDIHGWWAQQGATLK